MKAEIHHPVPPEFELPLATAEIVKHEPVAMERSSAFTPMDLLQMAVTQGADLDRLEKLMDLKMRWDAIEAKKAYDAAMNAFKANPPEITKNKLVSYTTDKGTTTYKHATLAHVCDKIVAELSKHGISHRWKTSQETGIIRVTCILTHTLGHSEETTLQAGPDTSGGKNAIQGMASTVSYLERYTVLAATGLASEEMLDDDGRNAETPKWDKLQENLSAFKMCSTLKMLDDAFKRAYPECKKSKDAAALMALVNARDDRKAELTGSEAA